MTEQEQRVWDAAYGAAFAQHYMVHYSRGDNLRDSPNTRLVIAKEAATIADEAVTELRRKKATP